MKALALLFLLLCWSAQAQFFLDKSGPYLQSRNPKTVPQTIVVGGSGTYPLAYSIDGGDSWTGTGADLFTEVFGVCCNSSGIWVAVGKGNAKLARSTDGKTWTKVERFAYCGKAVVWDGSVFIATGASSNRYDLYTSADGSTWNTIGENFGNYLSEDYGGRTISVGASPHPILVGGIPGDGFALPLITRINGTWDQIFFTQERLSSATVSTFTGRYWIFGGGEILWKTTSMTDPLNTWVDLSYGLSDCKFLYTKDADTIFRINGTPGSDTANQLEVSNDDGTSWTLSASPTNPTALFWNGSRFFAGARPTAKSFIYISENGGGTWGAAVNCPVDGRINTIFSTKAPSVYPPINL